jgi:hypothetical protein
MPVIASNTIAGEQAKRPICRLPFEETQNGKDARVFCYFFNVPLNK